MALKRAIVVVEMLEFKKVDDNTIDELRSLLRDFQGLDSLYSPGRILMWKDMYPAWFAIGAGCLIIRMFDAKRSGYLYPYPIDEDADIDGALDLLDAYMEETAEKLTILCASAKQLSHLTERYRNYSVINDRRWADYVYLTEEMAAFSGRKYSGQRNHIRRFKSGHPEAELRLLHKGDEKLLKAFWSEYVSTFDRVGRIAKSELEYAQKMFQTECDELNYYAGVQDGDKLLSICYGEKYGDCIAIHIEKALPGHEGIYPFMVNEFARLMLGKAKYLNREDDAGVKGLRTSKTQYRPFEVLQKSIFIVENELRFFERPADGEVVTSSADGFSLAMFSDEDSADYDRLCLDEKHNIYWGYDYKKDCPNPEPGYFLRYLRELLTNETSLSLAIRKDGRFIGEVVYFVFDGRGACKLGWRLLPEYCGRGYAAELFKLAGDYGLYGLGLDRIDAYCFKENLPSQKAISHSMKQTHEDDKYFYFSRNI